MALEALWPMAGLAAVLVTMVVVPMDALILPGSPPVAMHPEDKLFSQSDSWFYFQLHHSNHYIQTQPERT